MTDVTDLSILLSRRLHPDAPAAIEAAKSATMPVLEAHAISSIVIAYDGYGDEGQIEDITAYDAEAVAIALPAVACPRHGSGFRGGVTASDATLREALETLGYEVLAANFAGWENGEGALGSMTLDVASRAITLAHDWRVTALERDERTL